MSPGSRCPVQELNEYLTRIYTNSDTEDGYIHISFF